MFYSIMFDGVESWNEIEEIFEEGWELRVYCIYIVVAEKFNVCFNFFLLLVFTLIALSID